MIKTKAKIIAVVNPVGVGESAVIKVLTHFFNKGGLKTKSTYIKAFHGPSYLLWKVIRYILALKENGKLASWYVVGKVNKRIARLLLLTSIYLDSITLPFMLVVKVKLPKYLGITVLVEEYLLGTLLDYIYGFYKLEMTGRLYRLLPFRVLTLLCVKCKPDFAVLLDANLREIRGRWDTRGYGDIQVEYVLLQRRFLPKLAHAFYDKRAMDFNTALVSPTEIAKRYLSVAMNS